jgi:hypothetical protein
MLTQELLFATEKYITSDLRVGTASACAIIIRSLFVFSLRDPLYKWEKFMINIYALLKKRDVMNQPNNFIFCTSLLWGIKNTSSVILKCYSVHMLSLRHQRTYQLLLPNLWLALTHCKQVQNRDLINNQYHIFNHVYKPSLRHEENTSVPASNSSQDCGRSPQKSIRYMYWIVFSIHITELTRLLWGIKEYFSKKNNQEEHIKS